MRSERQEAVGEQLQFKQFALFVRMRKQRKQALTPERQIKRQLITSQSAQDDAVCVQRLAVHSVGQDGVDGLRQPPCYRCLIRDDREVANLGCVTELCTLEHFDKPREAAHIVGPVLGVFEHLQTSLDLLGQCAELRKVLKLPVACLILHVTVSAVSHSRQTLS